MKNDSIEGCVTGLVVNVKNIEVDYFDDTGDPTCTAGCSPGRLKQITDDRAGIVTSFEWYGSLPKSISSSLSNSGSAAVSGTYNNDIGEGRDRVRRRSPHEKDDARLHA